MTMDFNHHHHDLNVEKWDKMQINVDVFFLKKQLKG